MKLAPNWWTILTKAWSMYFMGLAALLSGVEAALAAYPDLFTVLGLSPGYAALAAMAVTFLGMLARVVAQKGVTDAK